MFPGSWRVRGSGRQGRGKESRRALTDWEDGEQLRVGLMIRFKTDLVGLRVGGGKVSCTQKCGRGWVLEFQVRLSYKFLSKESVVQKEWK